jgi:hypothetical protein
VIREKKGKPLSDTKSRSGTPPGCLVPFFAVSLVVGLLSAKTFLWEPLRDLLRARSWLETPCVVLSSEVKRHPGDESDTFSVAIRFRYSYDGATHESGRFDFESASSSVRRAKEAIVARCPAGLETTCWLNPYDSREAVIERGTGAWAWFALFPIHFVGVGAGGIWWVIRSRAPGSAPRAPASSPSSGTESSASPPASS